MELLRTDKEFSKENMPLDFLRRALSIAGLHSSPLKFNYEDFEVVENYKGVKGCGSVYPWSDEKIKEGYVKVRSTTNIEHNKGFDCFCYISETNGKIQGFYKESKNNQYSPDSVKWCNLLLEYGFLEIKI